jgi:hypothetical protein
MTQLIAIQMNIVTSFIGNPPEYWVTCIEQVRKFTGGIVWCITDHPGSGVIDKLRTFSNVKIVDYSKVRSNVFDDCLKKTYHKFEYVPQLKGRELLFMRAMERSFLCENLMKWESLKDVLFIELDNMIYMDPNELLESFRIKPLAYMFDNYNRGASGIMYVRDENSLSSFNNTVIDFIMTSSEFMTEMTVLFNYEKSFPECVQYLPTHDTTDIYSKSTYENLEKYPCIFDAASIGIYMCGMDPHHTSGVIVKCLRGKWSLIDFTKYNLEWRLDKYQRRIPWITFLNGHSYPIFNLHVHAKNLLEAVS